MKNTLAFLFIYSAICFVALAQDFKKSVITDPSISKRCDALLLARGRKIHHKQTLDVLILRNEKLQQIAPKERKTVVNKLKRNLSHLRQELKLTKIKIENQEENIIRKGCPGLKL